MSDRLASLISLLRSHGIVPGDRIAATLKNPQRLIDLLFATWRLGANFCPLNLRLPPAKMQECVARLDPKLSITDEGFFPMRGTPTTCYSSVFLFTSGSTGRPKIAVLSEKSLRANAATAARAVGLRKEDKWLLSLPLYHVSGLGIVLRCASVGAGVVLDEGDVGVTHVSCVQAQLYRAVPVYRGLKCLLLGGGPIGPIPERVPVYGTYGLTETGSMVTVKRDPVERKGVYYLGKPLEGREVRLEEGEVWIRGVGLFEGYWEGGEVAGREEWFRTGDMGVWCEREGLGIVGRKDWQFISGGENIQPEEIEREILKLEGVEEVVVAPRPEPEFGQRPVAFVKGTVDLERAKGLLSELLPKFKIPVEWRKVEEFPKKGLKIDRKEVIENVSS